MKTIGKLVMALLLSTPLTLSAANYWTVNGNGTWDASTLWSPDTANSSQTAAATTNADDVYFSANGITSGTVTVSGNQLANNLIITQSGFYFTGGTIGLTGGGGELKLSSSGTINSYLNTVKTITFTAPGQTLTLTGGGASIGGNNWSAANGATSSVVFQNGTYSLAGGLAIRIGNAAGGGDYGYIIKSGAVVNSTQTLNVAQSGGGANGVVHIDGGQLNKTGGNLAIGRDSGSYGYVKVSNGGALIHNTANDLLVGFISSTGVLDIRSGTVTAGWVAVNVQNTGNANGYGKLDISGGETSVTGIAFGKGAEFTASTQGAGYVNLTGGVLKIGGNGIVNNSNPTGSAAYAITLSGGTLGATAAWSSALNMKLTNDSGGVKFDTTGGKIELSGVLSGDGGFAKAGTGTLLLSGVNTYTGDTIVSAGNLQLDNVSALGGVANLALGSGVTVNLNYSGTATVDGLFYAGDLISGLELGKGYTYSELNTILGGASIFSGGGLLAVSSIPEPSALALMVTGGALLLFLRRKR